MINTVPRTPLRPRLEQLLASFEKWLGRPPCTLDELADAQFAVLAHGIRPDPVLWYGNGTALNLWKMRRDYRQAKAQSS